MLRRLRSDPRPFVLLVVAVGIIGGFFAVVAPLFATGGTATADLGGEILQTATVGHPFEVDLGFDNTGNSIISPTCLQIDLQGPLRASSVTFQGLDVETIKNGEVCGGALNGQETISLRVVLTPVAPGNARVTLIPAQGTTPLGTGISGNVTVGAS